MKSMRWDGGYFVHISYLYNACFLFKNCSKSFEKYCKKKKLAKILIEQHFKLIELYAGVSSNY